MTDNTGRDFMRVEDPHVVSEMRLPPTIFERSNLSAMKREEIFEETPESGFKIGALLSPSECSTLIALAKKKGFESVSWEYDPSYRKCTRVVAKIPSLAAELWRRIRPHLQLENIVNARPFGYGVSEGDVWRPYGINECIRFTQYNSDDHFAIHRDGPFVLTDEERSVFTVMVYLSDEYDGGETVFYAKTNRSMRVEEARKSIATIRGQVGEGLVFQHQLWHEGKRVQSGTKFILRTDLMFVRVAAAPLTASLRYTNNDQYKEAERLYQESIRLQKAGNPAASTASYLAALEIHAALEHTSPQYGPEYRLVPSDIFVHIFLLLPLGDILRRVWCVSRGFRALARHPMLWKHLYRQTYADWYLPAEKAPVNYQPGNKTPLKDWYTAFRTRWTAKHRFQVMYADIGSIFTRFGLLGSSRMVTTLTMCNQINGHYWSAGAGLGHHMCGEEVLSNLRWDGPPLGVISGNVNVNTLQIYIRWMLLEGWGMRLSPGEHPLLLARIPEMSDAMCTLLATSLQFLLDTPCIAFIDQAVCSLASRDWTNGLVFGLNVHSLYVTAVVDETVVATSRHTLAVEAIRPWLIEDESWVERAIPEREIDAWTTEVLDAFFKLAKAVLSRVSDDHKPLVMSHTVIRGLYSSYIKDRLQQKISAAYNINFVLEDITTSKAYKSGEGTLEKTHVSMDIYEGLAKICGSIGRAQKFFASVPQQHPDFSRSLVIMVEHSQRRTEFEDGWKMLQGWNAWDRDYNDDHSELSSKQVKCFQNGTEFDSLISWWNFYSTQLAELVRAEGVRVVWSFEHPAAGEYQKLLQWQARVGVPLLISTNTANTEGTDRDNLFWLRRYPLQHISFWAFCETKDDDNHKAFRVSLQEIREKPRKGY